MNRFVFLALRLFRVALGFLGALAIASAIVLVFDLNKGRVPDALAGAAIVGLITFQAAAVLWPLILVECVAEWRRWRSVLVHGALALAVAGGVLAWQVVQAGDDPPDPLLGEEPAFTAKRLLIYVIAGLAAGIVYWLVAGRSAGLDRIERTDP